MDVNGRADEGQIETGTRPVQPGNSMCNKSQTSVVRRGAILQHGSIYLEGFASELSIPDHV